MNSAQRIRERRIELSISEAALAEELGISLAAYGDLEQHEDELTIGVNLEQATRLSARLGIRLLDLLIDERPSGGMPSPTEVAKRIELHLAKTRTLMSLFEESVGWELQGFLSNPRSVAPRQPIRFFQDLAQALQLPPISLVPRVHVA